MLYSESLCSTNENNKQLRMTKVLVVQVQLGAFFEGLHVTRDVM